MAVSFIHCRSAELIERGPSRAERRQAERDHQAPYLRYHVLEIEAIKRILEDEGKASENGLARALHFCRGHFKTYGESSPLFGRLTGTYWFPMHLRGDPGRGIVDKDYRLPTGGGG